MSRLNRSWEESKASDKESDSTEASLHLSPRKAPFHISPSLFPSIHNQGIHSSRPTLFAQPLLQSPKYKAEHTSKSNSFILIVQNAKQRSKLPMVTSRPRTGEEERKGKTNKHPFSQQEFVSCLCLAGTLSCLFTSAPAVAHFALCLVLVCVLPSLVGHGSSLPSVLRYSLKGFCPLSFPLTWLWGSYCCCSIVATLSSKRQSCSYTCCKNASRWEGSKRQPCTRT